MSKVGKQNKKFKLNFSSIDAKEQDVIYFMLGHDPATESNKRLLLLAEKEYLERLYALQQELKLKYEPQFQIEDKSTPDDGSESDDIRDEVWEGNDDEHLTDLYYT